MKSTNKFKSDGTNWKGSLYSRGGVLHDKWGNTYKSTTNYRDNKTGMVFSQKGNLLGIEPNHSHVYSTDYKPLKKMNRYQTKRQKKIMITLRKKGKIR